MEDSINNLTIDPAKVEEAEIASTLMDMAFGDFDQYLFASKNKNEILKCFQNLWRKRT